MLKKKEINHEDYPMVLDWSNFKNTKSKLPCKCETCDEVIFRSINDLDYRKTCFCRECGHKNGGKNRTREPKHEDYPMVLDWSGYENTQTPLPCKCDICGNSFNRSIYMIDRCKRRSNSGSVCENCTSTKRKQTNTKIYGVENYYQSEDFKNTMKEKYGVENPSQSETVQNKKVKNKIEKHGKRIINKEDYPMVLEWNGYQTISTKLPCKCDGCGNTTYKPIDLLDRKNTCFCRKCGIVNATKTKTHIINKEEFPYVLDWNNYVNKRSKLPCKCQECGKIIEKTISALELQKTCFCSKCSFKIKTIETNIKKYGVSHVSKSEDIKNKKEKSYIERYGYKNPFQVPEIIDVIKKKNVQTFIKKFGCENPFQSTEIKEKIKETNLKKYGVPNPVKNKDVVKKMQQTNLERYGEKHVLLVPEFQEKRIQTNLERYGVPHYCLTEKYQKASNVTSKINLKWLNLIKKHFNIKCEEEFRINNFSYDLKIENLLIEINPTFTHNSTYGYGFIRGFTTENVPITPDYHFNKWKLAKDNGYTLISIYDNISETKMLNIIRSKIGKNKIKIGARKCEIKEIPQKECNLFLDEHHIQNKSNGQKYCIALFYENELVGVMTFGQPRFNKKYEWELVRLCFKPNITIQGGVSKMWNYFKTTYNPTSCICYLNLNLGGDNIHLDDFKFVKYNKPAGYWIHLKTGRTITNNSLRFKGASRFIGDDDLVKYPKGMDNREIMKLEGFVEMYDNGNVVYEYNNKVYPT